MNSGTTWFLPGTFTWYLHLTIYNPQPEALVYSLKSEAEKVKLRKFKKKNKKNYHLISLSLLHCCHKAIFKNSVQGIKTEQTQSKQTVTDFEYTMPLPAWFEFTHFVLVTWEPRTAKTNCVVIPNQIPPSHSLPPCVCLDYHRGVIKQQSRNDTGSKAIPDQCRWPVTQKL